LSSHSNASVAFYREVGKKLGCGRQRTVHYDDAGETAGVAAQTFLLVDIVGLSQHLDQDGGVHVVAVHLEQQRLDRLVPDRRDVAMSVYDGHYPMSRIHS